MDVDNKFRASKIKKKIFTVSKYTSLLAKNYYGQTCYEIAEKAIFKFGFFSNLDPNSPQSRPDFIPDHASAKERDRLYSSTSNPDLKKLMSAQLATTVQRQESTFDLRIMLANDKSKHGINQASADWDDGSVDAPSWYTVGRLTIPIQNVDENSMNRALLQIVPNDKVLSFNPGTIGAANRSHVSVCTVCPEDKIRQMIASDEVLSVQVTARTSQLEISTSTAGFYTHVTTPDCRAVCLVSLKKRCQMTLSIQ